ncbi:MULTISPECIES: CPBP family intramembrane glutamic endopeptidase [Bacillaceae]|uniref:CAAX prenyl protease 2/Lysostaphin resistance protein A-like domain-containing protein n=1 Tax=Alkalicoccobacillus plakortidis TaxID=444060 RepID=A0A9D5DUV6_9BACI|nr:MULTISPECIES: type II CAAX endopeptidase family protein [Bacillaceae]KQL57219.1 hypothetical protein AN965_09990 [Alkalicoccobacillus plakortidis]
MNNRRYGVEPKIGLSLKSLFGLFLILIFWLGMSVVFVTLMNNLFPSTKEGLLSLIVLYLSFVFLIIPVFFVVHFMFKIPIKIFLLQDRNRPNWKKISIYFLGTIIIGIAVILIDLLLFPEAYSISSDFIPWILGTILIAPLIYIAAFAEELLFRGYLYRMFRPVKWGKILVIIIPAILFTALHGLNPEMTAYGILGPLFYLVIAVLLSLVAYYSNGLGAPVALHFAYNILLVNVLSFGSASTLEGKGLDTILHRETLNINLVFSAGFVTLLIYIFYQRYQKK